MGTVDGALTKSTSITELENFSINEFYKKPRVDFLNEIETDPSPMKFICETDALVILFDNVGIPVTFKAKLNKVIFTGGSLLIRLNYSSKNVGLITPTINNLSPMVVGESVTRCTDKNKRLECVNGELGLAQSDKTSIKLLSKEVEKQVNKKLESILKNLIQEIIPKSLSTIIEIPDLVKITPVIP